MHDLACSVRPVPNGALTPSAGPGAPRFDRGDPMPLLIPTHRDVVTVLQSVGASATEVAVSRQLNGPALVDFITFNANSVNAITIRVIAAVCDDNNPGTGNFDLGEPMVDSTFGDTFTGTGTITGVGSASHFPLAHRIHRQLFRLGVTWFNSAGNAVVCTATFGVQFYRYATEAEERALR